MSLDPVEITMAWEYVDVLGFIADPDNPTTEELARVREWVSTHDWRAYMRAWRHVFFWDES